MRNHFFGLLLAAALAAPAAASFSAPEGAVCPVCLADFWYPQEMSSTLFDMRLDFRPVGMVASPAPLPVCKECGFVVFGSSAAPRELAAWRAAADSPGYKALKDRGQYFRLAFLMEKLGGHGEFAISQAYLKASWEEEKDPALEKEDLGLSLRHLEAFIAGQPAGSPRLPVPLYLRAELLRRLSRFDEALSSLSAIDERAVDGDFRTYVDYERKLCRRKDPVPHALGDRKRGGPLAKIADIFR